MRGEIEPPSKLIVRRICVVAQRCFGIGGVLIKGGEISVPSEASSTCFINGASTLLSLPLAQRKLGAGHDLYVHVYIYIYIHTQ